jgi:hypothetical protein
LLCQQTKESRAAAHHRIVSWMHDCRACSIINGNIQ